MRFSDFVGLSSEIEQLLRAVNAGRLSHAYLIAGARGSGKKTLANAVARALMCKGADKPCGLCPACKRYLSGNHPDARTISPHGKSIGVEEIRALIDALSNRSYEGGFRTVIIEQADSMTLSAQNALLKTLESPGGDTVFFLLTESFASLLATIRSRCEEVRMPVLSREVCKSALVARGIAPDRADLLAGISMGSLGRALEADKDEEFLALYARVRNSAEEFDGAASVAQVSSQLGEEKERSEQILQLLELLAADRIALANGVMPVAYPRQSLEKMRFDGVKLMRAVICARRRLKANVSWPLVLEGIYFSLIGD